MCFVIPAVVPWYFWGENLWNALFVCSFLRYVLTLNATWLVNSAAHIWGNRPYDRHINPSENLLVTMSAVGEGFHNYHHTYPSDYRTSEFGWRLNITTLFIDLMTRLGQVTERKRPSADVVEKRRLRTGDGSHTFGIFGEKYEWARVETIGRDKCLEFSRVGSVFTRHDGPLWIMFLSLVWDKHSNIVTLRRTPLAVWKRKKQPEGYCGSRSCHLAKFQSTSLLTSGINQTWSEV